MSKFFSKIRSGVNALAIRSHMALSNQRGDFYISDAVKSSLPSCWVLCFWPP